MTTSEPKRPRQPWEPRWPTLTATGLLSVWIAILSLPMWAGKFLAGPWSDQYASGWALRHWAAEQWRATGRVPLWNPEIMGGLPFVGAMHGDIFYPTAWLRLVLPTTLAMDLGFVVHYVLAGLFCYLFLRRLKVSWSGALTGGFVYQLSGVIVSYAQPGHDGKLFVTALLPLMLIALLMALRERRWEGLALAALAVGLGVVSPHPQMLQYALLASGIFALYLTFGDTTGRPVTDRLAWLAGSLGAVVVGVGIGAIQVLPFFAYTPFSPRAETFRGFEDATSYAIPWHHIPELFLADFVGHTPRYWGANGLKLHSEYLGLPALALAALGVVAPERRRVNWWLGAIAILFLLIGLGANTPFYRVWYELVPYVKQMRAPGMGLYIVSLVVAVWAAFGVARLEQGAGLGAWRWWLIGGAAVGLVAAVGGVGAVAESLAMGVPDSRGGSMAPTAEAAAVAIRLGAMVSGVALAVLGAVAWLGRRDRIPAAALALAVPLTVSADLWRNGLGFWTWSDVEEELYAPDPMVARLREEGVPLRVFDLGVYPSNVLMAHGQAQLTGHHGNELDRFDQLMGGQPRFPNALASTRLWDLYAVRYALLPAGAQVPAGMLVGFSERWHVVRDSVPTTPGTLAALWERADDPQPWARLVPGAIKVGDGQAVPLLASPRSNLDFDRVVLLDTAAGVTPEPLDAMPAPLAVSATVRDWRPGAMRVTLEPAAPQPAYLVIAENWYPDWHATVDGAAAAVFRGNVSLITVAVPAGAREVTLTFDSQAYHRGKRISLASLALVALGLVVPPIVRRRRA